MKDKLRKQTLILRDGLGESYRHEASLRIAAFFLEKYGGLDGYLLYSPIRSEADANLIAEELFRRGKTVFFPKVYGDKLVLGRCNALSELEYGFKKIKEPTTIDLNAKPKIAVVPGVAFDRNGYRLGYGKGFYDRFLSENIEILKVGLAYDVQIAETVYPESHDVPMDVVITERECFKLP